MESTTLLIMRHAKSDWNMSQCADFDRVLSGRGRRDAPRMGQWIVDNGYTPDRVICSPAQRAKETLAGVTQALQLSEKYLLWRSGIYNATLDQLLSIVASDILLNKTNLIIGHNPGVSELILFLGGNHVPNKAGRNLMPTAAITVLQLLNPQKPVEYGGWKIINYVKPRLLD